MKLIATTIAVTTLSLTILLVIVGIGAKSGSFIFQSANAQVTIFPGRSQKNRPLVQQLDRQVE
jgi:predicted PurR-regulated permease PerM